MKKKQNTRAAGTYTEAALGEEGEDAWGLLENVYFIAHTRQWNVNWDLWEVEEA